MSPLHFTLDEFDQREHHRRRASGVVHRVEHEIGGAVLRQRVCPACCFACSRIIWLADRKAPLFVEGDEVQLRRCIVRHHRVMVHACRTPVRHDIHFGYLAQEHCRVCLVIGRMLLVPVDIDIATTDVTPPTTPTVASTLAASQHNA